MSNQELAVRLRKAVRELEDAIEARKLQNDTALTMRLDFAADLVDLLDEATLRLLGLGDR